MLDFSKSLQVSKSLESLVSRGFGPQGLQTLLATSTGQVLISNNGATIFNALNIGHPVGRLIVKAIDKMTQYTGDGSKIFILTLSQILQHIDYRYTENERGQLLRAISHFTQHIFPLLQQHALKCSKTCSLDSDKEAFCDSFKSVLRSVMSPHYPARTVECLISTVLSTFNFDLPSHLFLEQVSIITQNFNLFTIKTIGPSVSDSTTLDSFIIQRDFGIYFDTYLSDHVRFVILTSAIEGQINSEDQESIHLSTNNSLRKFMEYQRRRIEKFAQICTNQKINLIISSTGITKYNLQVFHSNNISVIHYVEEEDAEILSQMCRKDVISEFPRDEFSVKEIFVASSCVRVIINGKPCVQVTPCGEGLAPYTKTLVLTAPTEGLCRQLYTVLHKAIKSLYLSINLVHPRTQILGKSSCESVTMPGGSTFELMCSNFLFKWSKNKTKCEESQMAEILADAFLGVARTLHRNVTETTQNQTRDFLLKLSTIREASIGDQFLGFDRRGTLQEMDKEGILEPCSVKFHVVSCVMELLYTIMKTDGMIGTKNKVTVS